MTQMIGNDTKATSKFINAREEENLKYMKVRYWVSDEQFWFYFIYVNPCLVLTSSVLSITKAPYLFVLIDVLFIFFV